MTGGIPDLWRTEENAQLLYSFYLSRLPTSERMIEACRRIRQFAKSGPGLQVINDLDRELDRRAPRELTRGLIDLVQSPEQTRTAQERLRTDLRRHADFEKRIAPRMAETEAKLRAFFPELQH